MKTLYAVLIAALSFYCGYYLPAPAESAAPGDSVFIEKYKTDPVQTGECIVAVEVMNQACGLATLGRLTLAGVDVDTMPNFDTYIMSLID